MRACFYWFGERNLTWRLQIFTQANQQKLDNFLLRRSCWCTRTCPWIHRRLCHKTSHLFRQPCLSILNFLENDRGLVATTQPQSAPPGEIENKRGRGSSGRRGHRRQAITTTRRGRRFHGEVERSFVYDDLSLGWRQYKPKSTNTLQREYTDNVIIERARSLGISSMKRLNTELRARSLEKTRVDFLRLQDVLEQSVKHQNGHTTLNDPGRFVLTMTDMLRWVAVMFLSSLCDITYVKAIEELRLRDCDL